MNIYFLCMNDFGIVMFLSGGFLFSHSFTSMKLAISFHFVGHASGVSSEGHGRTERLLSCPAESVLSGMCSYFLASFCPSVFFVVCWGVRMASYIPQLEPR